MNASTADLEDQKRSHNDGCRLRATGIEVVFLTVLHILRVRTRTKTKGRKYPQVEVKKRLYVLVTGNEKEARLTTPAVGSG